jgi:hypothetical protein
LRDIPKLNDFSLSIPPNKDINIKSIVNVDNIRAKNRITSNNNLVNISIEISTKI